MDNQLFLSPSIIPNELISSVFLFLNRDSIEKCQIVNKRFNDFIIANKNYLPLRCFEHLSLYNTALDLPGMLIYFENSKWIRLEYSGTVSSRIAANDEIKKLTNCVFRRIHIRNHSRQGIFLALMELVRIKGGPLKAMKTYIDDFGFNSYYNEIFAKNRHYACLIRTDKLIFDPYTYTQKIEFDKSQYYYDPKYPCINGQLFDDPFSQFHYAFHHEIKPATANDLMWGRRLYMDDENAIRLQCDNKNPRSVDANDVTFRIVTQTRTSGNFCQKWFEKYSKHANPILLIGKFDFDATLNSIPTRIYEPNKKNDGFVIYKCRDEIHPLGEPLAKSTKLFLNELGNQVEYSYTRKESRLKRFCTVHATESYALVIVMKYEIQDSDEQEIIASNLDYPGIEHMKRLTYWVKKIKPFVEPISSESESESDSESGSESETESGNDS